MFSNVFAAENGILVTVEIHRSGEYRRIQSLSELHDCKEGEVGVAFCQGEYHGKGWLFDPVIGTIYSWFGANERFQTAGEALEQLFL